MKFRKLTRMSKGPFIIYVQGGRDFEEGHIFGKSPIGGGHIFDKSWMGVHFFGSVDI